MNSSSKEPWTFLDAVTIAAVIMLALGVLGIVK
jgi:hypothetical protein